MTNTELQVKHTPAPWKIHKTPNDPDFTHEIFGVCSVYVGENSEANARLIEAAPELLEAVDWCIALCKENGMTETIAYASACTAKAKVTGGKA